MNFWILVTKNSNFGLEAGTIEPAEHLVELFPQNEPYHGHRKFLELHRLAKDPAEDLRGIEIIQFASRNLKFQSDEVLGTLKGRCGKGTDVVCSDCLVWLVRAYRVHQFAL